jgi:hypothetical protein
MIVTNVRTKVIRAMNVSFMPGTNVIETKIADLLKQNRGFNTLVSDGTLLVKKETEAPAAEDSSGDSGKLTAPEMVAVVNGMCDVEGLTKLKASETRKTVLKAIDERLSELNKTDDGEGGEGGDGGNGGE